MAMWTETRYVAFSMLWSADDPGSDWRASVARDRLHGHAPRLSVVGTPYLTTGNYLSVLGGGAIDITFSARNTISFYWGSVDSYVSIRRRPQGYRLSSPGFSL